MRVDPALVAYRGDCEAQRRARREMELAKGCWLAHPAAAAIKRSLAHYGAGAALTDCDALPELVCTQGRADAVLWSLFGTLAEAWQSQPLGAVPVRHALSGGIGELQLLQAGRATLSLLLDEPGERAPVHAACFSDLDRHEIVFAGRAEGRILRCAEDGSVLADKARFERGTGHKFDRDRTRLLERVETSLVTLRLTRRPERPKASRLVRLSDGAVEALSAARVADSRRELAILLLGLLDRQDAAPRLAKMALGNDADSVRWQALRHSLALAPAIGLPTLERLASEQGDSLAGSARNLLNHLRKEGVLLTCPA